MTLSITIAEKRGQRDSFLITTSRGNAFGMSGSKLRFVPLGFTRVDLMFWADKIALPSRQRPNTDAASNLLAVIYI
ncbi:hypothetical protein, partial [Bacillus subtilis]|uniref:hypothetical protein n=1 Tax=Bacillus subtilis TaxID=1423 RepID=UPI003CEC9188